MPNLGAWRRGGSYGVSSDRNGYTTEWGEFALLMITA
jgi:hypothetical protein